MLVVSGSAKRSKTPLPTSVTSYHCVAEYCGSRSMRRTFLPFSARVAARLTAVVVFPDPPF